MQNIPTFSVVIVNYNHGQYLEEAILSVLSQSSQDFELIIVDGGSADDSIEIIKKYSNDLSWWVSEKDNGQSDAFNKGFAKAKGYFYFWINADDLLLPGSLEYAKKAIMNNPGKLWFSANTIFFSSEGIIEKCSVGPSWNSFLLRKNSIYVYGPTSIFHHSLFEKAKGFDPDLHFTMDGDLWYKFYNYGEKFIKINHFFWGFRVHENSKTSHAFKGIPNKKFSKERVDVLSKNNRQISKRYHYFLFIYKLLSGAFLKSLYYSLKFKEKKINLIKL